MSSSDTDKNLLFAVIALQSDLISMRQFVDACTLWTSRKGMPLADVLVGQGWLVEEDRKHVEYLLNRRMKKDGRSPGQTMAALPNEIKSALASINDRSIHESLRTAPSEPVQLSPLSAGYAPQLREKITLRGLHSSGGIGQVWTAYDEILEREVALKELKADMAGSTQNRERFFREARLTGQLEHPGIVPVYEFSSDDGGGRSFYTMRFVKGRTLTQSIQAFHDLRKASASGVSAEFIRLLNVFVSICNTIAYAHSRHVIHRDLKGDNVILGDFGEVIVLDWGLAKRLGDPQSDRDLELNADPNATLASSDDTTQSPSVTMQGDKLGTPAYMAPEQAKGRIDEIDELTDVYGLAAMLYDILTGEPPFLGTTVAEILHRVIQELPVPPTDKVAGVPPELEQICLKGLAKDRRNRQQSASELAQAVQVWIAERADRKRTEQERERFFSLSLDMLAILDENGTLNQTNPAWKNVLEWEPADLETMTILDIVHPDERPQLAHSLERILAGEALTAIEHRCRSKNGSYRWILWNASLIAGESSIYIVGRDITERKQSEQTFQEILESAPDAMVIVNATGQIVLVNAQLQRIFGYTRDELLGQPIEILVPEQHRKKHPANVAQFVSSPEFRPMAIGLELRGQRKDGTVFPAEISLSPVRTEKGFLVSCAVRDITKRQSQ